jgi:hypothetical protein
MEMVVYVWPVLTTLFQIFKGLLEMVAPLLCLVDLIHLHFWHQKGPKLEELCKYFLSAHWLIVSFRFFFDAYDWKDGRFSRIPTIVLCWPPCAIKFSVSHSSSLANNHQGVSWMDVNTHNVNLPPAGMSVLEVGISLWGIPRQQLVHLPVKRFGGVSTMHASAVPRNRHSVNFIQGLANATRVMANALLFMILIKWLSVRSFWRAPVMIQHASWLTRYVWILGCIAHKVDMPDEPKSSEATCELGEWAYVSIISASWQI